MDRPFLNLFGTLTYLFVVLYAGPKYMKNRPAFNLRKYVVVYNVIMVLFSTYIFYEVRKIALFYAVLFFKVIKKNNWQQHLTNFL